MNSSKIHFKVAVVVSIIFACVLACKPEIHKFNASPNYICVGDPANLTWDVSGAAILSAQPSMAKTGLVKSSSSKEFILNKTTYFTMTVFRNKYPPERRKIEVKVLSNNDEKEIVPWTEKGSSGGLVATESKAWGDLSDIMVINRIINTSDRALKVVHNGKEIIMPVNGFSDEMKGFKISGPWEIYADLKSGEVIGDPNHPPPDRLRILVKLQCKGKSSKDDKLKPN
jgi:hypothetical protein